MGHTKEKRRELYCILNKPRKSKSDSKPLPWHMKDRLFTAEMIESEYKIAPDLLPQSAQDQSSFIECLKEIDTVKTLLQQPTIINRIIFKTKWHKIKIYSKRNNKERNVMHLTKNEFVIKCQNKINPDSDNEILPIVVFDKHKKHYPSHQYILIMDLSEQHSIGISFKFNSKTGEIYVTGIHLDKESILMLHQLINPQHMESCTCLERF